MTAPELTHDTLVELILDAYRDGMSIHSNPWHAATRLGVQWSSRALDAVEPAMTEARSRFATESTPEHLATLVGKPVDRPDLVAAHLEAAKYETSMPRGWDDPITWHQTAVDDGGIAYGFEGTNPTTRQVSCAWCSFAAPAPTKTKGRAAVQAHYDALGLNVEITR